MGNNFREFLFASLDDHCSQRKEFASRELNDLRKIICLRKNLSFCSVERISVYKVIENLMEHGMLPQIFNDFILSAMLLHQ